MNKKFHSVIYRRESKKLYCINDINSINNKLINILELGDILVAEPATYSKLKITDWVARFSRFIQNTRWGHTCLYDGEGNIIEAKVDVIFGSGKEFDGVSIRTLKSFIEDQNFLVLRPSIDKGLKKEAVERMKKFVDKDYIKYDKLRFIQGGFDILGIRQMKKRDYEIKNRIICSEVIAIAYDNNIDFYNGRHYSQILPAHIARSKNLKKILLVDRIKVNGVKKIILEILSDYKLN